MHLNMGQQGGMQNLLQALGRLNAVTAAGSATGRACNLAAASRLDGIEGCVHCVCHVQLRGREGRARAAGTDAARKPQRRRAGGRWPADHKRPTPRTFAGKR